MPGGRGRGTHMTQPAWMTTQTLAPRGSAAPPTVPAAALGSDAPSQGSPSMPSMASIPPAAVTDALPVASPPVPPAAGSASSAVHSGSAAVKDPETETAAAPTAIPAAPSAMGARPLIEWNDATICIMHMLTSELAQDERERSEVLLAVLEECEDIGDGEATVQYSIEPPAIYVVFSARTDAERALDELRGRTFDDRVLEITWAEPKQFAEAKAVFGFEAPEPQPQEGSDNEPQEETGDETSEVATQATEVAG